MSWTIESLEEEAEGLLKGAITRAVDAGILLFCASNDQGKLTRMPYPARLDERMFRIGAATALGDADPATQKSVMFIAPGSDEVKQTAHREDLGFAKPRFGSSIATARCAGLAALILQCITLGYAYLKSDVRTHENMHKMFMRLVDKTIDGDSQYLRVWTVFEVAKSKAEIGTHEELNIIRAAAAEFMNRVDWNSLMARSPPLAAGVTAQHTTATDSLGISDLNRVRQRMARFSRPT
jgi:hypothetical protein